jgi:hypothetical protein
MAFRLVKSAIKAQASNNIMEIDGNAKVNQVATNNYADRISGQGRSSTEFRKYTANCVEVDCIRLEEGLADLSVKFCLKIGHD